MNRSDISQRVAEHLLQKAQSSPAQLTLACTAECSPTTLQRHLTSSWGSAAFFPNNGPNGFHNGDKRSPLWIVIEKHVKQPTIKRSKAKRLAFPVFMCSTEEIKHVNCTWLLTSQNIISFTWKEEKMQLISDPFFTLKCRHENWTH